MLLLRQGGHSIPGYLTGLWNQENLFVRRELAAIQRVSIAPFPHIQEAEDSVVMLLPAPSQAALCLRLSPSTARPHTALPAPCARHGKQLPGGRSGERRVPRRGGAGLAAGEVMLCSPQEDAGWGHVLPAMLACFCGQTEQVGLCECLGSRDGLAVTRGRSGIEVLPATCLRNREIVD